MDTSVSLVPALQCRVCGAPARYSYFGVRACPSCKMFFKRNAENDKRTFICRFDGECEVNALNRHICAACRLAKCFRIGMRKELLRASVKTTIRPKQQVSALALITDQDRSRRLMTQIQPLNLLRMDTSLLDTDEWMLLTNLVHGYDESRIIPIAQYLAGIRAESDCQDALYHQWGKQFMVRLYETAGSYILGNRDLCHWSSANRSLILREAVENVICLSATYILHRTELLKNQLFCEFSGAHYGRVTESHHLRIMQFIDSNHALVQLVLALFTFVINGCIFNPYQHIGYVDSRLSLPIQNRYAEVTWKYLVYKYGYHQAVLQMMNMVRYLLAATEFLVHAKTLALHMNDTESLVENMEINLILEDVEEMT